MDNIFQAVDNTQEPTETVFSQIADDKPKRPLLPAAVSRHAMMAAVADSDVQQNSRDLLAEIQETKKLYQDQMSVIGDSDVRRQKAYESRARDVRNFVELSRNLEVDEETREGAAIAASQTAHRPIEQTEKFALEEVVADKIQALAVTDPDQARLFEETLQHDGTMDLMRDRLIKDMMIERAIDEIGADDRGKARKVADFLVDIVAAPIVGGIKSSGNLPDNDRSLLEAFGAWIAPGRQQEEEAFAIDSMTSAELAEVLPDIVKTIKSRGNVTVLAAGQVLSYPLLGNQERVLREIQNTPTAATKNALNAIEVGSLVPVGKGISVTKALVKGGARKQAIDVQASVLRNADREGLEAAAEAHGLDPQEVVENMLPASMKVGDDDIVGFGPDAAQAHEEGTRIFKEIVDLNATSRLTDEEKAARLPTIIKKVEKTVNRPVKDVEIQDVKLADGSSVSQTISLIGKAKGDGGFATEAGAKRVLSRYGLAGEPVQDASGQWFARAVTPIREEGFYTAPLEVNAKNKFGRFVRGGAQQGDKRLGGSAQQGGRAQAKIFSVYERVWNNANARLSKKQRGTLDSILTKNTDDEVWHTPQELEVVWEKQTGRSISPLEKQAYFDQKRLMDMEYAARNEVTYKQKALQGFETVKIGDLAFGNGRVKRTLNDIPSERTYNLSDDVHHTKDSPIDAAEWERMKKDGYIHVTMEEAVRMPDGTFVRSFVAKGREFGVSPLRRIQIPYKAGPHRLYKDQWFSKSANVVRQSDTGTEALTSPRTFRTFPSERHAREWNEVMNQARLVADNPVALAKIFDGRPEFPTPQQFADDVKAGKIDPTQEFETLFDQQLPTRYNTDFESARFFNEASETSLESLGRTQGRLYHSQRGDKLLGYDGNAAPTLSPSESIAKSVANVSRLAAFGDYQIEAAERFVKTFSKYFDVDRTPALASPQQLVRSATLREGVDPQVAAQFEAQRAVIGRVLNHRTPFDDTLDNLQRHLDRSLDSTNFGVKTANYLKEKNPFNGIRAFAFHTKLGLFNVAQFPLQASTSIQAALLSPNWVKIRPDQAYGAGIVMRYAAEAGPIASKLAANPKIAKALGWDDVEDAQEMIEAFAQSGWLNVDNSHALINSRQGTSIGKGRGAFALEKAKQKSGLFFYEAEKWNRSVAFSVAWREAKARGGSGKRTDGNFMNEVMRKADDYAFQMTAESRAAFQKGPASIPTQFFSYQTRMVELMTGKTLTRNQKAKLIGGQTLLYGSAGLPVVSALSDRAQAENGESFEAGSVPWVLDRGVIDSVLHASLGVDVAVGDRIGTGSFFTDVIGDFMDMSSFGNVTPADMLGGASVQIAGDTYDDFKDVVKYATATQGKLGDPLTQKALVNLAGNISSVGNATKAYYALKYQQLYSGSEAWLSEDITTPEAFFILAGIQPADMNDIGAAMDFMSDHKTHVEDTAKLINTLKTQWVQQPDRRDTIAAQLNSLRHITDDLVWQDAQKKASRFSNNQSLNESVANGVKRQKAREDMIKRLNEKRAN